jgi:Domain of unknown function (DUF1931)
VAYSDETKDRLPELVGGMSLALGRAMKLVDPKLKNPQTRHWETAQQIFDLLF